MTLGRFYYQVTVELDFSLEDVDLLIGSAQRHYDDDCRAAGSSYEDGYRSNGFIKQLRLFTSKAVWTSRQIDLALKVIEPYNPLNDTPAHTRLRKELNMAFEEIQRKQMKLNGV